MVIIHMFLPLLFPHVYHVSYTLHLTGYLQEVHCPLSICGLCIKCHCHWPEFERHLSQWGDWRCMYTQNGQPQHPSRSTHIAHYETCTSTFATCHDTHFMPQSSSAWHQWQCTNRAWKSHLVWSPQSSQEGMGTFIKLLMVGRSPVMHLGAACW